jgi:hypothetical protein
MGYSNSMLAGNSYFSFFSLYQLLAYADLPGGTLVYAAAKGVSAAVHAVVQNRERLEVVALDLSAPRPKLRQQISEIAERIRLAPSPEIATDIVRYRFHLRRFNAALRRPLSEWQSNLQLLGTSTAGARSAPAACVPMTPRALVDS